MTSYTASMLTSSIDPETSERIRKILSSVLNIDAPEEGTDLIETGLLDSLALVSLILELETEFGLSVSYDELEIDNFRTLESIAQFLSDSLAES